MRSCRSPHARGPGPDRPGLPLPPARMPRFRGGRPLKHWRWVGAFGPDAMACAARASVGGIAGRVVGDVGRRAPARAACARAGVGRDGAGARPPPGSSCASRRAKASRSSRRTAPSTSGPASKPASPCEGRCSGARLRAAGVHRRHRRLPRAPHGLALVGGRRRRRVGRAGGVEPGRGRARRASPSERTVWVDGTPHHVDPLTFADDLSGVGALRARPSPCARTAQNRIVASSEYEMPFGRFSGSLPHAGPLREGWGVMERHRVRW